MSAKPEPKDVPFDLLVQLFEKCSTAPAVKKRKYLARFREQCVKRTSDDIYQIYRLLLPDVDNKRGVYQLKEKKLILTLIRACNLDPKYSSAAKDVLAWKSKGASDARSVSEVLYKGLFRTSCGVTPGSPEAKALTVGQLNDKLDQLVVAGNQDTDKQQEGDGAEDDGGSEEQGGEEREQGRLVAGSDGGRGGGGMRFGTVGRKAEVLQWLVLHTTPVQMKWIVQIVLKDLKIGMGKETILKDFHPDALALYNSCSQVDKVVRELKDPNFHMPSEEVTLGSPCQPQLADIGRNPEEVFRRMGVPEFVVEYKFDGWRLMCHKMHDAQGSGDGVRFFSRKNVDHSERGFHIMDPAVLQQLHGKGGVVLDGEMVAWNRTRKEFEPFSGLRRVVKAIEDGCGPEDVVRMSDWDEALSTSDPMYAHPKMRDLELVYIAFDILYCNGGSVIHLPLNERHKLLRSVVGPVLTNGTLLGSGPVCGRVVPLLPGEPLLNGAPGSMVCRSLGELQAMFDQAISKLSPMSQLEGVVAKRLDMPWRFANRSGSWLKLKPDYVQNNEVDCVIIGAYYGESRANLGRVSQFLMALPCAPPPGARWPVRYKSFCRVGSGVTAAELAMLREKLLPYMQEAGDRASRGGRGAGGGGATKPSCYEVTGEEQPDVWVMDPSKSVVLQVKGDVRSISTSVFATRHSLRFPRTMAIRYDRDPSSATTYEELLEQLANSRGLLNGTQREGEEDDAQAAGRRRKHKKRKAPKRAAPALGSAVIAHFRPTDTKGLAVREQRFLAADEQRLPGVVALVVDPGPAPGAKAALERRIFELGGEVHQNWSPRVTHILAARPEGYRYDAQVARDRDVISLSWLDACEAAGYRLPLRPRHYLHISRDTVDGASDMDEHGDGFYSDVTPADLEPILEHRADLRRADLQLLAESRFLGSSSDEGGLTDEEGPGGHGSRSGGGAQAELLQEYDNEGRLLIGAELPAERRISLAMEEELLRAGLLDPVSTLLRGCTALVLSPLPLQPLVSTAAAVAGGIEEAGGGRGGSDGSGGGSGGGGEGGGSPEWAFVSTMECLEAQQRKAGTAARLHHHRLQLEVELHGGRVADHFHAGVTHLLLPLCTAPFTMAGQQVVPNAAALLAAVRDAGGGGVGSLRVLRRRLAGLPDLQGRLGPPLHFVGEAWLISSVDSATAATAPAAAGGGGGSFGTEGGGSGNGRQPLVAQEGDFTVAVMVPAAGGSASPATAGGSDGSGGADTAVATDQRPPQQGRLGEEAVIMMADDPDLPWPWEQFGIASPTSQPLASAADVAARRKRKLRPAASLVAAAGGRGPSGARGRGRGRRGGRAAQLLSTSSPSSSSDNSDQEQYGGGGRNGGSCGSLSPPAKRSRRVREPSQCAQQPQQLIDALAAAGEAPSPTSGEASAAPPRVAGYGAAAAPVAGSISSYQPPPGSLLADLLQPTGGADDVGGSHGHSAGPPLPLQVSQPLPAIGTQGTLPPTTENAWPAAPGGFAAVRGYGSGGGGSAMASLLDSILSGGLEPAANTYVAVPSTVPALAGPGGHAISQPAVVFAPEAAVQGSAAHGAAPAGAAAAPGPKLTLRERYKRLVQDK